MITHFTSIGQFGAQPRTGPRMHIKQLTVHGLKSYRDETVFGPFSPQHNVIGITCHCCPRVLTPGSGAEWVGQVKFLCGHPVRPA